MSKLAPITMEAISGMDADNRRNTLGERLFTLINEINPERVAKITGMMLERDPETIIKIINKPEELVSKVDEAVSVCAFCARLCVSRFLNRATKVIVEIPQ